jgi:hypothetical protein
MRTSFVRYVSPTPRHTSFRKERAIVGAARGRSASAIPDLELIHPGVSDLNRETPFGNSTRILSVVVAHLHCADRGQGIVGTENRSKPKLRLTTGGFCPVSRAFVGLGPVWLVAT